MTAHTDTRVPAPGAALALAELGLVLVHLAVVVGFGRLYLDNSYLFDLGAYTLGAHTLALVTRRHHLPWPVGWVLGSGGALLVSTWLLFPSTTTFGLPSGATVDAMRAAMDAAGSEFRTEAAPTEPVAGFQLAAGLALWGAVWFADWAAFRLRTAAEALAPAAILFVFCTVLGTGASRFSSAVLFAGAVLFFVANHRALLAERDNAWLSTTSIDGARSVRRAALGFGATVIVVGSLLAPATPGYDDEALVRWRNTSNGGGLRTTVSPIVDLQRRLVSQSDRELFEVRSDVEAYWRLTSLHEFDGQIWSSGGDFGLAEDTLRTAGPLVDETVAITQEIRIDALSAIWVPAAYQARILDDANRPLRWNPDSSTLIVDSSSDDSDGLTYTVTSARPVLDPATLRRATGADPSDVADRYLRLPDSFPELARTEARRALEPAGDGARRYDQALALQDYFRDGSFTYETDIPAGHGNDALVAFLENRQGYCEQFAGAYAAMARSLGIPARVAVGFTSGDRDPTDPTRYTVKGLHAHAWPEVYFPDVGWVPFEPTPGRGMPGAEEYTGLAPDQDHGTDQPVPPPTTTIPQSTTVPDPVAPPTTTASEVPVPGTLIESSDSELPSPWRTAAVGVALALAAGLLVLLVSPAVRAARHRTDQPRRAVQEAWDHALTSIRWATGLRPRPAETHHEFARRVADHLASAPPTGAEPDDLDHLATIAAHAAWDPTAPSGDDVGAATRRATALRARVVAHQPVRRRIRRRLSWREAFGIAAPT